MDSTATTWTFYSDSESDHSIVSNTPLHHSLSLASSLLCHASPHTSATPFRSPVSSSSFTTGQSTTNRSSKLNPRHHYNVNAYKAEIDSLRHQLHQLQSDHLDLQARLNREIQDLHLQLHDSQSRVNRCQTKNHELESQRKSIYLDLKSQSSKLESVESELHTCQQALIDKTTEFDALQASTSATIHQLQLDLNQSQQTYQQSLDLLKDSISSTETKLVQLQSNNEQLAAQNQSLTTEITQTRLKLDMTEHDLCLKQKEILLFPRVSTQRREVHESMLKMQEVQDLNTKLKAELNNKHVDHARLRELEEQQFRYTAHIATLNNQIQTLCAREAELMDQLATHPPPPQALPPPKDLELELELTQIQLNELKDSIVQAQLRATSAEASVALQTTQVLDLENKWLHERRLRIEFENKNSLTLLGVYE